MGLTRLSADVAARLHQRARAWQWDVPVEVFAEALERSLAKAGPEDPETIEPWLENLRLDDLALACACDRGHERAWEHFVREYTPVLRRAATAIAGDSGPDLADGLHAELFGVRAQGAERRSLFRYFHGRSSLATWLRAVLAQRHVDMVRSARRLDPLPDDEDGTAALVAPAPSSAPGDRDLAARVRAALSDAIAALAPRDRLRLDWYYAEDMTLAHIGRALGEHEATVSRHLARTRKALRADVEQRLADSGLPPAAVADAFDAVVREAGDADLDRLLATAADRKNPAAPRSTGEEHA